MLASKVPTQHSWPNCSEREPGSGGRGRIQKASHSATTTASSATVSSPPPRILNTQAFLFWDGGGIILILQNAQQLIKSRSPSAFKFFCM